MWATQNPTKNLYFIVFRGYNTKRTSLLEMELKGFFSQQHNLQNVEVLGLPSIFEDTLSSLLKEVTTIVAKGVKISTDQFFPPKK